MKKAAAVALALLLCALGALSGCTSRPSASVRGNSGPSSHEPAAEPAAWVSPPNTTANPVPIRFALVSSDGRTITMTVVGGGCTAESHVASVETGDAVTLRMTQYLVQGPCLTNLTVGETSLTLQAPLGTRRLLDGYNGRRIKAFDGRRLAAVGWLPAGARSPRNSLDGAGWIRLYEFPAPRREAPIWIAQTPGNILGHEPFHSSYGTVTKISVHGLPARLSVERDEHGALARDSLAWLEDGFTFEVTSMPSTVPQRVFTPTQIEHVAQALSP